jgi:hypothetical protein
MENNIPLRNLDQDLNHEERQEINNSVESSTDSLNRADENLTLCTIGIIVVVVMMGFVYLLGSASCKSNETL